MLRTTMRHISHLLLSGALLLCLTSCLDKYDEEGMDMQYANGKVGVELSLRTLSISSYASSGTDEAYVAGSEWENYIDIAGGDYRVYFFTHNTTEEKDNTLIAEFNPTDIELLSTSGSGYASYTLSGEVDEELIGSLTSFKVLVVANWGTYPTVTVGTTTIDDICNAETAVFSAFVDEAGSALMPSFTLHIPFFGLRDYSDVTWTAGRMTRLSGDITLLRSVAKVEVIYDDEYSLLDQFFDNVSIVNYNSQGYCAPTGVYLKGDYDHDGEWDDDFVDDLHLVNNGNDTDQEGHTIAMFQTTNSDGYETWVAYLTEYDNSGDTDYSYISVTIGEQEEYKIYFGNYDEDGQCTAYDTGGNTSDRYDIYRNYLYRFRVTMRQGQLTVVPDDWENVFDNEYDFSTTTSDEAD